MTVILVTVRDVYGKPTIYPEGNEAKALAKIAGTTTLKPETVAIAMLQMDMRLRVDGSRAQAEQVSSLVQPFIDRLKKAYA